MDIVTSLASPDMAPSLSRRISNAISRTVSRSSSSSSESEDASPVASTSATPAHTTAHTTPATSDREDASTHTLSSSSAPSFSPLKERLSNALSTLTLSPPTSSDAFEQYRKDREKRLLKEQRAVQKKISAFHRTVTGAVFSGTIKYFEDEEDNIDSHQAHDASPGGAHPRAAATVIPAAVVEAGPESDAAGAVAPAAPTLQLKPISSDPTVSASPDAISSASMASSAASEVEVAQSSEHPHQHHHHHHHHYMQHRRVRIGVVDIAPKDGPRRHKHTSRAEHYETFAKYYNDTPGGRPLEIFFDVFLKDIPREDTRVTFLVTPGEDDEYVAVACNVVDRYNRFNI